MPILRVFSKTISILLLFIFASTLNSTLAANIFVKYPGNPIFSPSLFGNWDSRYVSAPTILKKDDQYMMWYQANEGSGVWKIGYASSSNGISNWTRLDRPVINVGSTDGWEAFITEPRVLFDSSTNTYKMWYGSDKSNWVSGLDRFRLRYATSSDGVNWIKSGWVLTGTPGAWDEGGINRGTSIIYKDGLYHLWYGGTNSGFVWRIGYVTSPDGINWTKQNGGNPVVSPTTSWELNNVSFPTVIFDDGIYKMWYGAGLGEMPTQIVYAYSNDGINWTKPSIENPVLTTSSLGFDKNRVSITSAIHDTDAYRLWYSGYDGTFWAIGLATSPAIPVVTTPSPTTTPTPSPTPTPTPTHTPTPTPTPLEPIVIIPGMLASWNKEAMILGQSNPTTPWKLLPFVKEYIGIISTLKNLGYIEEQNLFLWPYDWRKSVNTISSQLNTYLNSTVKPKNPQSKIIFIGHSLGGLVSRGWAQAENDNQTAKIITLGSPHQGVTQAYRAWSGGDLPQANSLLWLAGRLILLLQEGNGTPRQIIQQSLPIMKDLIPVTAFLRDQTTGQDKNPSSMVAYNAWLDTLNSSFSSFYPKFTAINGTGFSTPLYLITNPPNSLDLANANWLDGKPIAEETTAIGDNTVPVSRASFSGDPAEIVMQNHSGIIASSDGIKKILDTLGLTYTNNQIVSGSSTNLFPSLVFLIRSPASLKLTYNNTVFEDTEGIIIVPSAADGNYKVQVTGTGTGNYTLTIGQINSSLNQWNNYQGSIAPAAVHTYLMQFNSNLLLADPVISIITPTATPVPPPPKRTPTPTSIRKPTPRPAPKPAPKPDFRRILRAYLNSLLKKAGVRIY